jgi:hypothetical protein
MASGTVHIKCHQNHPAVMDFKHAGQMDSQTDMTIPKCLIPACFVNNTQHCMFCEQHTTLHDFGLPPVSMTSSLFCDATQHLLVFG